MSEDAEGQEERKQRQLRLLGVGTLLSGVVVLAAAQVSANPYEPLVGILAFLGIATMVFEYTEDMQRGASMGFLVSGILVWLYPVVVPVSEGSPLFVGSSCWRRGRSTSGSPL